MSEQPEFIGKHYSEDEKADLTEGLHEMEREDRKESIFELEKTPEELKMIRMSNDIIQNEFQGYGIQKEFHIDPEQIHIYSPEAYQEKYPGETIISSAESRGKTIDMQRFESKETMFIIMMHEMIHLAAHTAFYAEVEGEVGIVHRAKTGYRLDSPWKEKGKEKFVGLNEAVVELTTHIFMLRHKAEIVETLGINFESMNLGYYNEWLVFDSIVKTIAKSAEVKYENIVNDYIVAQFTGGMMHLRDIDRLYGKGSLRILALLGHKEELTPFIQEYFETDSEAKRQEVREKLLPHIE
ncbi:MAG: hypothetical protein K0S38_672 [Candidatus Paceibacter sp.]|jgi:hypothetical protein|nr:hypothetical protein [Candidatus Paceibacter sp.]